MFTDHVYDRNRRFVLPVTNTGGHSTDAEALFAYLDLSNFVTTYQQHLSNINESVVKIAAESTLQAAKEAREYHKSKDVIVSVDGTWQRRGFSRKNGIVTVVTNQGKHQANKVIDTEI